MPSEARQKKFIEKLNRAQKCSILGPQNLWSRGGPGPPGPPPGSASGGTLPDLSQGLPYHVSYPMIHLILPTRPVPFRAVNINEVEVSMEITLLFNKTNCQLL